jgi:hypothetical protein
MDYAKLHVLMATFKIFQLERVVTVMPSVLLAQIHQFHAPPAPHPHCTLTILVLQFVHQIIFQSMVSA